MTRKNISFFVFIAFFACTNQQEQNSSGKLVDPPKKEIDVTKTLYVEFDVKGMTCEGCENTVKKNIEKLEGIAEVKVSHENKCAKVRYDTTLTNLIELSTAITEAGYTVEGHQQL